MANKKYVRLSDDHTKWTSAIHSRKPRSVSRWPDEKLPEFNWFEVKEIKQQLPDSELYRHQQSSWELIDNTVHVYYEPALIDLERRREIMVARCHALREERLWGGIVFASRRIDTKFDTKLRVGGLVSKAIMDSAFTTSFITMDNEMLHLDADATIALGNAFATFEAEQVFHARAVKDQIMASDAPETIPYQTGWPSNEF